MSMAEKIKLDSGLHLTSTTEPSRVKFITGFVLSTCHSLTVKSAEQEMKVCVWFVFQSTFYTGNVCPR